MTTTETETTTQAPPELGTEKRPAEVASIVQDFKPVSCERLVADSLASKISVMAEKMRWCADAGWLVTSHFAIRSGCWDRFSLGKLLSGDRRESQSMLNWLNDTFTESLTTGRTVFPTLPQVCWEFGSPGHHHGFPCSTYSGEFRVTFKDAQEQPIVTVNARKFYSLDRIVNHCDGFTADYNESRLYWHSNGQIVAVLMGFTP